jgi:hypothetical protein
METGGPTGAAMKKYFFDRIGQGCSEYDFSGHDFAEAEKALQLAQLLALDLEVGGREEFVGGSINVRNADGHKLFSVPIGEPELAAA